MEVVKVKIRCVIRNKCEVPIVCIMAEVTDIIAMESGVFKWHRVWWNSWMIYFRFFLKMA